MYVVVWWSSEYGKDQITYSTFEEAYAGMRRIQAKAEALQDGIERFFTIEPLKATVEDDE